MYKQLYCLFFSFIFSLASQAQEMIFLAQSSSPKVSNGELLQIEYSIVNPVNISQFQLPNFEPFKVVGPVRSALNTTEINGRKNAKISYIVNLQSTKLGKFVFKPARANSDASTIHSNSVEVEVVVPSKAPPPTATPTPNVSPLAELLDKTLQEQAPILSPKAERKIDIENKIFAIAEIDKKEIFQGEQTILNYNLYTQLPIRASLKKIAAPLGFWMQDIQLSEEELNQSTRVMLNGREFRKYTLRKVALFPTQTGKLTIPPIEIEGIAEVEQHHRNKADDEGFLGLLEKIMQVSSNQQIPFLVKTDSLHVQSVPLPENAPNIFKGSVGSYAIESNLDKSELSTDEAITLVYTVRGKGNLKLINTPITFFSGDFEVNTPNIFDTITNSEQDIAGYKTFKFVLLPRNAGRLHIPAAQFCFFDPSTKEYTILKTNSYDINVRPGSKNQHLSASKGLPQDIHDIMNEDDITKWNPKTWSGNIWYWLAYIIPILVAAFAKWYRYRKNRNIFQPKEIIKKITTTSEQRLQVAQELIEQNNIPDFYNEARKAVWLYLSDKLNIPLSKLDKDNISQYFAEKKISTDTIDELHNFSNYCDTILYANAAPAASLQDDYNRCKKIIDAFEKSLNS